MQTRQPWIHVNFMFNIICRLKLAHTRLMQRPQMTTSQPWGRPPSSPPSPKQPRRRLRSWDLESSWQLPQVQPGLGCLPGQAR